MYKALVHIITNLQLMEMDLEKQGQLYDSKFLEVQINELKKIRDNLKERKMR